MFYLQSRINVKTCTYSVGLLISKKFVSINTEADWKPSYACVIRNNWRLPSLSVHAFGDFQQLSVSVEIKI